MQTLIISQQEAAKLLPMNECIGVMERAFRTLANANGLQPLRASLNLPEGNVLALMPAYLSDIQSVGAKIISVFPKNHGTAYDAHQGVVLLFDTTNGELCAIIDATAITAIRTGAVSGLATKLLANSEAGNLALLGAGTQARGHLEAMMLVRKIRRVRVWDLFGARATEFAQRESSRMGVPIEVVDNAREAVIGADLICTTTASKEPVLMGQWIAQGAHINAVGASIPQARELDSAAVVNSRMFVDWRESALNESGDFLFPKKEGLLGNDHILGNIGDVLEGKIEGRKSFGEITLFKALGLAIEDLASAFFIYNQALEKGIGTSVEIGGQHFASNVRE